MPSITITEEDFARLIRGESVERDGVGILLDDFGYDRMLTMIDGAIDELQARQGGRLLDMRIRRELLFDGSPSEEDPKFNTEDA